MNFLVQQNRVPAQILEETKHGSCTHLKPRWRWVLFSRTTSHCARPEVDLKGPPGFDWVATASNGEKQKTAATFFREYARRNHTCCAFAKIDS
jgi:hypothetical protein